MDGGQSERRIVYLAGPYSSPDLGVQEERFRLLTEWAARMVEGGAVVYSPITMSHPIDRVLAKDGVGMPSSFWVAYDEAFMDCCYKLVVLRLPGWEKSAGVAREIEYFKAANKPIIFVAPPDEA